MAIWSVMADVPNPIIVDAAGTAGSGYVLKAYLPGGTTSTSIAIDSAGGSPQTSLTANANGAWEVSGNEVLPYIDRKHKWGIFANSVDAAANTPFYLGPFDNVDSSADHIDSVVERTLTVSVTTHDTVADAKAGLLPDGSTFFAPVGALTERKGYYELDDGAGAKHLVKTAAQATSDGDIIDGFFNLARDDGNVLIIEKERPLNIVKGGLSTNNAPSTNTAIFQAAIDLMPSFSNIFSSDHAGYLSVSHSVVDNVVNTYLFDTTLGEILLPSGIEIAGDKTVVLRMLLGVTFFGAKDRFTSANFHITMRDFTIDKDASLDKTGTIGLDFTRCSYSRLEDLRIRTFEKGIVGGGGDGTGDAGGFYNNLLRNEVANCTYGVYSDFSFNSSQIIGGRYLSNDVGLRLEDSTNNTVMAAFEKNNLGALVVSSNANDFGGSRFEGSGKGAGGGGPTDLVTGGAIRYTDGSKENNHATCWFSGASDHVIDIDGRNGGAGVANHAGGESSISINQFCNPSCDVDSNADGEIDGANFTQRTGLVATINTVDHVTGLGCQQITVDPTNTARSDFLIPFSVVPDQEYTVSVRVKTTSDAGVWNLRIGLGVTGLEFANLSLFETSDPGFCIYTVQFNADSATLAGQEFVYLNFFMNSVLIGSNSVLLIDSIAISEGIQTSRVGVKSQRLLFTSTTRPTLQIADIGQAGWCGDLATPEWWDGVAWVDATGTPV